MSPKALSVPTNAALSHTQRLPARNPSVAKTLSRLNRESLLELALEWLNSKNRSYCLPHLARQDEDDEDAPYTSAASIEEVVDIYRDLKGRKGGKKEVVDRMLEGDWRHGITLYQLAMAETRYLLDHPNSQQWNALQLSKVKAKANADDDVMVIDEGSATSLPRFHATSFVLNLQREVAPVIKAHYYITRVKAFGICLLRVYIQDSPYDHPLPTSNSPEGSKSLFMVFPDGSPYVYVSIATNLGQKVGAEGRSLRKVVVDAVPKALSKPHHRFTLTTTSLSSRNLSTLLSLRGPGRSNAAPAGWSIFAENSFGHASFDYDAPRHSESLFAGNATAGAEQSRRHCGASGSNNKRGQGAKEDDSTKRRKKIAEARFGPSGHDDGKGLESLQVRMEDPFPQAAGQVEGEPWTPDMTITLRGSHIHAGVRQLVEHGVVEGERMPGWMVGEAGVSVGVVKNGRIKEKS
ncbi:centromere protein Chl4/mis15/CENP-N [Phyllosticta citribraziliensis]|uniref:Centromere protein Chl4/mis15/CENP-N n=1 Tax=Phyllosticta citribraziliensis TaxID=989973 RepID=A0ABR1LEQ6_9PEZI